MEEQALT